MGAIERMGKVVVGKGLLKEGGGGGGGKGWVKN